MIANQATISSIFVKCHRLFAIARAMLPMMIFMCLWSWQANAIPASQRLAGGLDQKRVDKVSVSKSGTTSPQQDKKQDSKEAEGASRPPIPVDLEADNLSYDQKSQIITASGNVELVRGERILRAEEVRYNLEKDIVNAHGDVVLLESGGEVVFAEKVELRQEMRRGFVKKIRAMLVDGSRLRAAQGRRTTDDDVVMEDAAYTPCKPCAENPAAAPIWRISADKVTHDKKSRTIAYEDATLDIYGQSVLYTPYFRHPDGTIDRKSGFLLPGLGGNSEFGASVHNKYYWSIAPSLDATLGVEAYTGALPRGTLEVRKRFANADLKLNGSFTESDRVGVANAGDELRGHLFGAGLWNLDKHWRTGFQIETSSDDQFLREYNISNRDVLENELFAERFDTRNYFGARLLHFQDVRISERVSEQPDVLPQIETHLLSPYDWLLGGRLGLDASFLGLRRDDNRTDLNRISVRPNWRKRFVSARGLVSRLEFSARGDVYNVSDNTRFGGSDGKTTEGRVYPYAHYEARYPLVNRIQGTRLVVTPRASVTLAPDVEKDDDLPNEDSQDVQLDASNLFQPNRFPGLDRVEDGAHAAYGLQTGLYRADGARIETMIGQSQRLESVVDADNPFPEGSGLADDVSDFVGEISGTYKSLASLQYRFQYDGETLDDKRHELDAELHQGKWDLSTRYLFARALQGTNITNSREQLSNSVAYQINNVWRVNASSVYDFGEDDGLRRGGLGVEYTGQCFTISGQFQRNLVDDVTGESETELVLRIGLRNLGSIKTSGIGVSQTGE